MATKSGLAGFAWTKVLGGYPTADASVWIQDVDFLMAAAVNYVQNKNYFIDNRAEGEGRRIQPLFLITFKNVGVTYDADLEKRKSILPKKPLALPLARAIPFIGSMTGKQFVPTEQGFGSMTEYTQPMKGCQTSFEITGLDVLYENLPPLQEEVMIRMLVNAVDMEDDDDLFLPDGAEIEIANLMVEFFTGQRQLPKDYLPSGKDPNSIQQ